MNGARLGGLEDEGASLFAPSRSALYLSSLMFHSNPWRMCHALKGGEEVW